MLAHSNTEASLSGTVKPRAQNERTALTAAWLLLAGLAGGLVCSSSALGCHSRSDWLRPESSLSETSSAQADFRRLHARWIQTRIAERVRLQGQLEAFLVLHGGDERARLVRVYLALTYVERGQLESARLLLTASQDEPEGASRDFARVAEAAILIRRGLPEQALARLEPLSGKIVDADERYVFGEQVVLASLLARRWRGATEQAITWLATTKSEDVESAQRAAAQLFQRMPLAATEERLRFLDAESDNETAPSELAAARDWLRKLLRERLASAAILKRDSQLARRLLDMSPGLRRGDQGEELARLASSQIALPNVAGRSLGLVLSQADPDVRRRSIEVSAGMARALGLPNAASSPDAVMLLTEPETGNAGSMETALAALAGQGAAILIAGMDAKGAERAARFAESSSIPVLLLTPPSTNPRRFGFVLGASAQAIEEELSRTLVARGLMPVKVGPGGVPCSNDQTPAHQKHLPLEAWKREHALGLLFSGDAECAKNALDELGSVGLRPTVAFGLMSAELVSSLGPERVTVVASTGKFPRVAREAGEPLLPAPSWYEVLGHDAALLGAAALADFGSKRVADARAVTALHQRARDTLSRVEARLWSSEQPGFAGGQVLARRFQTIIGTTTERMSSR